MQTIALYYQDAYLREMTAEVKGCVPEDSSNRWRLLLTQTIFYPMGGGQPTDQGRLAWGGDSADIYQVQTKDGDIWHYVQTTSVPEVGTHVFGVLNWERRYKNMRVHSAGHIIDFAMYMLAISPLRLSPVKGDHGRKPYIVYEGTIKHDFKEALEKQANEIVTRNLSFKSEFVSYDTLKARAIYLQPGLPIDKELRALTLDGIGTVADGGTQVSTTEEVGRIAISSIVEKDGNTTIHYSC